MYIFFTKKIHIKP